MCPQPPCMAIDDLEGRLFPGKLANIPTERFEFLVVLAGFCSDNPAIDEQVDTGFILVIPATDQEGELLALNGECRRSERAGGFVAAVKAVDQAVAEVAADFHLVRQRALCGARPKCLAGGFPVTVVISLEVGKDDIGACCLRRRASGQGDKYGEDRRS